MKNLNKIDGLGERIKQIRRSTHQTQVQFARRMDVNQRDISRYERNLHFPPAKFLIKICYDFGRTLDWLLTGREPTVNELVNRPAFVVREKAEPYYNEEEKELFENYKRLEVESRKAVREFIAGRLLLEGREYQSLTDETKPKEKLKSTA